MEHKDKAGLTSKVWDALMILNMHYGYGDIKDVRLYLDGGIDFVVQGYVMPPQTRRGHLRGNTVFALRHQRKIAT